MKITKILNNNAVIVIDDQQEKIAIGAGIAFHKKKNDIVNVHKIEKLFVMKENKKLQQLLNRIPEEHFTISEEVITYAEDYIGTKLNEHIHVALTDHLSFAIERATEGIHLKNKLLHEIKILYKPEFEIGLWAIKHIKEKLSVEMPVDEAAFIALHIHTMKLQGGDLRQTVRHTTIVRDMVQTIKSYLNIEVEEDDISYQRLITHLRFALTRMNHYELHTMDEEMLGMIKKKFPLSYSCATEIAKNLSKVHGVDLPDEELGYITLHIERLRKK
ncbi:PRD domain-containing protein [Lederbergia lenta]|uniref:Transcriptional antiterminator n=1 Tax=Lederbergia lenta TaxID=1467 RepID=A0A2X4W7U9_LEDLE|nr:PRD domain-containing protein [Lederbergia lenta]MCM3110792.1 PRD domain-containing protein [Lederbergia lenta]MEC2325813.1 PRD domain-containing protein [Lederbergia lenta]SQI53710.1 transcriptional antiterminator [Lederbergia lenta]